LNFLSYLRSLTDQLVRSYNVENKIEIIIKGAAHQFGLNQAVPLGLIFTELITNSFKYGFDPSKKGKVEIAFAIGNQNTRILFSDNGKGLPPDVDFENSDSFGFRIIRLLTRQMKADIKLIKRAKGTAFKIEVPVSHQIEDTHVYQSF
jgi:two-component sensor histidine kinase